MLPPRVTVKPSGLPVNLSDIKHHAVIDYDEDDALVLQMIEAAVSHIDGPEGILFRAIMPQTVVQYFTDIGREVRLPYGDVLEVIGLSYRNAENQKIAITDYTLFKGDSDWFLYLEEVPRQLSDRPDAVEVEYTAGWASEADVPAAIKQAVGLLVSHWFENRDAADLARGQGMSEIPLGVKDLLSPFRKIGI